MLETNFKVPKAISKLLKSISKVLKSIFKVLKVEVTKIQSVPFVSQVIRGTAAPKKEEKEEKTNTFQVRRHGKHFDVLIVTRPFVFLDIIKTYFLRSM